MMGFLSLWSHAVAALLFAVLALWRLRAPGGEPRPVALIGALAASALWALAVAGTGSGSDAAGIAEGLRNLGYLGFMFVLLRNGAGGARRDMALVTVYGVVALVALATIVVTALIPQGQPDHPIALAGYALRMMVAAGALVLVHNLYSAASPATGPGFRAAIYALAAMWVYDLNLYTIAYLGGGWPRDAAALRGLVAVGVAAILGLGLHRSGDWTLQLSRSMTFRTLSLVAVGVYLLAMMAVTSAIAWVGGDNARIAQAAFVFGTSAAALALPSARARAWIKVKLAKHLFQHRYDYRAEWLRFTDTLGKPGDATAPLAERVVKAVADITDSPDGLLFVPEGEGLTAAARWNWPVADTPPGDLGAALVAHLAGGPIVELDAARRDGDTAAHALLPQWLIDDTRAWVLVPLVHFDRVAGAVVLGRPPLDRALDWEDFDLLRVAGRQVASYLAESQGQQALDDARRFDEFNRRFAFIMHDIKNLVSQLSLVARNAERHADNPEFRADMVATLKDSADRMNALLARLAQHNSGRSEAPRPVLADEIVGRLVAGKRLLHPVAAGRTAHALVLADPARLEALLGHLVQNAIDASAPDAPVRIDVRSEGDEVAIDVIDHGCGMSPAFMREKLFTAFASTKESGFGVGAYEARQLARAMGGRIAVTSREGEGSRFTVFLPAAHAAHEKAA